jgi:hypothetical protein
MQIKYEDNQIRTAMETKFPVNSTIHHFDTRQYVNFHQPSVNVTKFQKGVSNLGTKVFNMLPSYIKFRV